MQLTESWGTGISLLAAWEICASPRPEPRSFQPQR